LASPHFQEEIAMENRHRLEIEARRRIMMPQYGPEAYTHDHKREIFPFGRGKPYPSPKAARAAADKRAAELQGQSTAITITTWNGHGGRCEEVHTSDRTFSTDWDGSTMIREESSA
jgi:hypothetical protein